MATNARLAVKARRRHTNLSMADIRIAQDNVTRNDNDVFCSMTCPSSTYQNY